MKVPRLGPGEPATSVISFEIEQMVLAALARPARAALRAPRGDLARSPTSSWSASRAARSRSGSSARRCPRRGGAARRRGRDGAPRPSPPGRDPPRREALERHDPARTARRSSSTSGSPPRPLPGPARGGVPPADRAPAPYIAPEQVLGVRCDPRSDVFALGACSTSSPPASSPFGAPTSRRAPQAALARPDAAARARPGRPGVAAGGDPALPRGRRARAVRRPPRRSRSISRTRRGGGHRPGAPPRRRAGRAAR